MLGMKRPHIQRETEAGSDQKADEDDWDTEGPEVPTGPHGMFIFSSLYSSSVT